MRDVSVLLVLPFTLPSILLSVTAPFVLFVLLLYLVYLLTVIVVLALSVVLIMLVACITAVDINVGVG